LENLTLAAECRGFRGVGVGVGVGAGCLGEGGGEDFDPKLICIDT
jgi:hypothetical protein